MKEVITMKKFISFFAAAVILTSLTACSEKNNITPGSSTCKTVFRTAQKASEPLLLATEIAGTLGDGNYCMVPVSEEKLTLSVFNGLDLSKIESYAAEQTAESDDRQDLIAIFKCKNGYAEELTAILNNYYEQIIINTRQHRFEVLKANGTRIYRIGDTVMFILAGKSPEDGISTDEEAALAEAEYAKIDGVIKKMYGYIPENLAEITMDPSWARSL